MAKQIVGATTRQVETLLPHFHDMKITIQGGASAQHVSHGAVVLLDIAESLASDVASNGGDSENTAHALVFILHFAKEAVRSINYGAGGVA